MNRINMKMAASAIILGAALTACSNNSASSTTAVSTIAETTTVAATTELATETVAEALETQMVTWETIAPSEVTKEHYAISNGAWYYHGIEDEKYIDMDGLSGFTSYTAEAIPDTDGYLRYIGINPDGYHEYLVYDLFARNFTTMIFVSEDRFYLDGNEDEYYVRWDF